MYLLLMRLGRRSYRLYHGPDETLARAVWSAVSVVTLMEGGGLELIRPDGSSESTGQRVALDMATAQGVISEIVRDFAYLGQVGKPELGEAWDSLGSEAQAEMKHVWARSLVAHAGGEPAPTPERIESGPIKFGDDWTGLFLRGDDASTFAQVLQNHVEGIKSPTDHLIVRELLDYLQSVREPCDSLRLEGVKQT